MPGELRSAASKVMRLVSKRQLVGLIWSVVLTLLAVLISYQVRPGYDIMFGKGTDGDLLDGFNKPEVMESDPYASFRWTTGDASITLQDIGSQDLDVTVQLNGMRPRDQPRPSLLITANGRRLLQAQPPPAVVAYTFRVPRSAVANSTLVLHLTVSPFTLPNDVRELGIVATSLRVTPAAGALYFIEPPIQLIVSVACAAAVFGLALILLGWSGGAVFAGATLVGMLASWLLVTDRLWLTGNQWYLVWAHVVFGGLLFVLLVARLGGVLLRRVHANWSAGQRQVLLTVMLVAFIVRLAGQLHPQINVVDLNFHAHRLEWVESGRLLFKEFSVQSGNRDNFYLPGVYLFILPIKWLVGERHLAIMLFTVGLSTLGAFLIFYIARRVLRDGRAGVLASGLYLILPMSIIPFSWGITPNLFAEFFSLLVFAIVVGSYDSLQPGRPALWLLLVALFVVLLGHSGVVQLLLLAYFLTLGLWVSSRGITWRRKKPAAWAFAALAAAMMLAYTVYYVNWTGDILNTLSDIARNNDSQTANQGLHVMVSGPVNDVSLGLVPTYASTRSQWILGGLRGFWQEAQAYYRVWPIFGAILGFLLIHWSRKNIIATADRSIKKDRFANSGAGEDLSNRSDSRSRLVLAALAWTLSINFFAIVGLALNLYVRYMLFALPIVSLGCGILLCNVWVRGRRGQALTLLLLAFFAVEALALWQHRITYLYK